MHLLNRSKTLSRSGLLLLGIALLSGFSHITLAAGLTPFDSFYFSSDVATTLPGSGGDVTSDDASIIAFDLTAGEATSTNDLGVLATADIDGYHHADACGDALYSLDTSTDIAGTVMRPADVFTAAGVKLLDASAEGVASGINIDAVSRDPSSCDLVVSVDSITTLDGAVFRPDDLILFSGGAFSLYAATNFTANIDALHVLASDRMLVSFDNGVALPDLNAFDEQIIEIITGGGAEQLLAFNPTTHNASWQAADLDAIWAEELVVLGDCTGDGGVDILDVVCVIDVVLSGGVAVNGANCDAVGASVNVQDVICTINKVLAGP